MTRAIPEDAYIDFEWVTVERRFDGAEIETEDREGWALLRARSDRPDRAASTRAERDALRLAAMLLAHWDNKASNQRLVCVAPGAPALGRARVRSR